jgi:hypothetical protein
MASVLGLPTYLFVLPWAVSHRSGVNQVVINIARQIQRSGTFNPIILILDWTKPEPVWEEFDGLTTVRWLVRTHSHRFGVKDRIDLPPPSRTTVISKKSVAQHLAPCCTIACVHHNRIGSRGRPQHRQQHVGRVFRERCDFAKCGHEESENNQVDCPSAQSPPEACVWKAYVHFGQMRCLFGPGRIVQHGLQWLLAPFIVEYGDAHLLVDEAGRQQRKLLLNSGKHTPRKIGNAV